MTTNANYKTMFTKMGFSVAAAKVLVDTEGINSMAKLAKITSARASKLTEAIRSPGGTGAGQHVMESAEHNLVIAAAIANDIIHVSRTIVCADIGDPTSSQFELHEQQRLMEEEWDDKGAIAKFTLFTEKELKKG